MELWILGLILLIGGLILRALAPEQTLKTIGYILAVVGAVIIVVALIFLLAGELAILPFLI